MTDPLTEAERAIVKAAANYGAWSMDEEGNDFEPDETVAALLDIIDRLSAAPVDDQERVPEGRRVEWSRKAVPDTSGHISLNGQWEDVPFLVPVQEGEQ